MTVIGFGNEPSSTGTKRSVRSKAARHGAVACRGASPATRSKISVSRRDQSIDSVTHVPREPEAPARAQDARQLGEGGVVIEPMEGLCRDRGIDRGIAQRQRLRGAGERCRRRDGRREPGAHRLDRLDGDDARPQRDEL